MNEEHVASGWMQKKLGTQERRERLDRFPVGYFQFEDHDRDDDGEDAVAERFETGSTHGRLPGLEVGV